MKPFVWRCDVCARPVADDDGYLCVDNYEAVRRRDVWREDRERRREAGHPSVTLAELTRMPGPVGWEVLHRTCDPRPDTGDYWIDVGRLRTLPDLLEWNAHLHEKNWTDHTDWDRFLQRRLG